MKLFYVVFTQIISIIILSKDECTISIDKIGCLLRLNQYLR